MKDENNISVVSVENPYEIAYNTISSINKSFDISEAISELKEENKKLKDIIKRHFPEEFL